MICCMRWKPTSFSSLDVWHKPMFETLRLNIVRSWRGVSEPDTVEDQKDIDEIKTIAEKVLHTLQPGEAVDRLKRKLQAASESDEEKDSSAASEEDNHTESEDKATGTHEDL